MSHKKIYEFLVKMSQFRYIIFLCLKHRKRGIQMELNDKEKLKYETIEKVIYRKYQKKMLKAN